MLKDKEFAVIRDSMGIIVTSGRYPIMVRKANQWNSVLSKPDFTVERRRKVAYV